MGISALLDRCLACALTPNHMGSNCSPSTRGKVHVVRLHQPVWFRWVPSAYKLLTSVKILYGPLGGRWRERYALKTCSCYALCLTSVTVVEGLLGLSRIVDPRSQPLLNPETQAVLDILLLLKPSYTPIASHRARCRLTGATTPVL